MPLIYLDKSPEAPSGTISVAYTWLPTWIGMDKPLLDKICGALTDRFRGEKISDEKMVQMEQAFIEELVSVFPHVQGLRELLEAARAVRI